jgi:hypothetical protein
MRKPKLKTAPQKNHFVAHLTLPGESLGALPRPHRCFPSLLPSVAHRNNVPTCQRPSQAAKSSQRAIPLPSTQLPHQFQIVDLRRPIFGRGLQEMAFVAHLQKIFVSSWSRRV